MVFYWSVLISWSNYARSPLGQLSLMENVEIFLWSIFSDFIQAIKAYIKELMKLLGVINNS